jgi:glycosyltransferase involved in cell wall biosynthesis
MEERPLITFALFAYNQEQFIEEAVQGALSQTYSPLEIILSDDNSSDQTFRIMDRMSTEYQGPHRIILSRNTSNLGIVPHVNKVVMELSHGELIVMAAGDDISLPERTETLWRAWVETGGGGTYGISSGFQKIDTSGNTISKIEWPDSGFVEGALSDFIRDLKGGVGCSLAFHKDVFSFFGPIVIPKSIEDRTISIRARILGKFYFLKHNLVSYRVTGNNITKWRSHRERIKKYAEFHTQIYQQVIIDLNCSKCSQRINVSDKERIIGIAESKIRMLAKRKKFASDCFIERFIAWVMLLFDPNIWLKQHISESMLIFTSNRTLSRSH